MPPSNANATARRTDPRFHRYVARQPILTADEKVFGYELLFRDGVDDYFTAVDADAASRSTLDSSILIGLDVLCDSRQAFVNCTREVLLKDYITLLPPDQIAVEVLETVPPDDLVIAACERLAKGGYTIALDDFGVNDPRAPLVGLAKIIKVDMRSTPLSQAAGLVRRYGARSQMLAEKVETREEFLAAQKAGFKLFQGYFFRRPEVVHARQIPANQLNYLRLLKMVSMPEINPREIENMIKGEASLCYRLLRYLNSPIFGFPGKIQSVRHALAILGEREVRRWIRLVVTLGAADNKPSDLVLSALVRARFCELLGPRTQHGQADVFLVGLLSLMDSILELPMGVVLEGICVDPEMKAVLLGEKSQLTPLYELMVAQEAAEWAKVGSLCAQMNLDGALVAESHWQAMRWAREMTAGAS
ncbi:MAG: HDOD domain-containing protein [Acidobacteriia bacterium]|nr:HDOD domain-containing protein [Terriglobia bacterium]